MDSNLVACEGCGTKLKIPASFAAGKKLKCPKCGELVSVPQPADEDVGYAMTDDAAPLAPARVLAPASKRCPYCGESILADAMKCRHCGEFLDPQRAATAAKSRAAKSTAEQMNPAEYVVAVLAAPVGIIIGIVWAARRIPKGKDMIKVSSLCTVIALAGAVGAWGYKKAFFSNPEALPTAITGAGNGPNFRPLTPDDFADPDPTPRRGPPRQERPQTKVDMTGQPPHIQRAMRANVRVETGQALGSGVIVQREGKDAIILTNRHVVDMIFAGTHSMNETPLKDLPFPKIAYLNVESQEPGKVLWVAPEKVDLAIIKAPCPEDFEPVPWLPSGNITAGESVFAIGNPLGYDWSFSRGVVSQVRLERNGSRDIAVIQTDTAITHGNSGGGLYNDKGELIGINTYIANPNMAKGLGFAIRTTVVAEFKPETLHIPEAANPAGAQ